MKIPLKSRFSLFRQTGRSTLVVDSPWMFRNLFIYLFFGIVHCRQRQNAMFPSASVLTSHPVIILSILLSSKWWRKKKLDLILYTEMNQQKSDLKHFQAPPTGFFSRSDYKKKKMDMEKKKGSRSCLSEQGLGQCAMQWYRKLQWNWQAVNENIKELFSRNDMLNHYH